MPIRIQLGSPAGAPVDVVRPLLKDLGHEIALWWRSRRTERVLARTPWGTALQVHLGAGGDIRPGWLNVDAGRAPAQLPPGVLYVSWDLRRSLPLPDGCCELVYSSHLLEHFGFEPGTRLLRESYRLLCPGGTLRLSMPNFNAAFRAYIVGDDEYFEGLDVAAVRQSMGIVPGTEATVDLINYLVYQHGEHLAIYDEEKLTRLLRSIGFSNVLAVDYSPGLDPDVDVRRRYSLYMEATK